MGNVLASIDPKSPRRRYSEAEWKASPKPDKNPRLIRVEILGEMETFPLSALRSSSHKPQNIGSRVSSQRKNLGQPNFNTRKKRNQKKLYLKPKSSVRLNEAKHVSPNTTMSFSMPPRLIERLNSNPARNVALFPTRILTINPSLYTKMLNKATANKWSIIEKSLLTLRAQDGQDPDPHMLQVTIYAYYYEIPHDCNFRVIEDPGISQKLRDVLPAIAAFALKVKSRLSRPIEILKQGENRTIYLTRDLACSFLANAFFCTMTQPRGYDMASFDFFGLFHDGHDGKTKAKIEKLKCILEYFSQMRSRPEEEGQSIISFERRSVRNRFLWAEANSKLCPISIVSSGRIEDNHEMLQVDFANRYVGGGVLNDEALQEEIRFSISPELICSRLLAESLLEDEVLVITGTKIFCEWKGFSSTFRFQKFPNHSPWSHRNGTDNLGREYTQVVAMDALQFKEHETDLQYKKENVDRELHKCYVGFMPGYHNTPVTTGNWGGGTFNGDPELKFLIQWMAASVNERPDMKYYALEKDGDLIHKVGDMAKFLLRHRARVGQLYNILSTLDDENLRHEGIPKLISVFQYVKKYIRLQQIQK